MQFFKSLDEGELASEYIWEHKDTLKTESFYANGLKSLIAWLKEEYPQEAILLHRDSAEKSLATSKSQFYPSAIKALKDALKIEEKNDTLSWEIEEGFMYMEKLINMHRKKPKFVQLFFKAFGDL